MANQTDSAGGNNIRSSQRGDHCSTHKFPPDVAKKGRMPKRKQDLQERIFAVDYE
jgi:hypothetical protein